MQQDKHSPTPRPWRMFSDEDGAAIFAGTPGDGYVVSTLVDQLAGGGTAEANAALIVRAVNSHDALVEALKPFAKLADTWTVSVALKDERLLTLSNGERMCGVSAADFERARAALLKASPAPE